jgi:hypothetical protein
MAVSTPASTVGPTLDHRGHGRRAERVDASAQVRRHDLHQPGERAHRTLFDACNRPEPPSASQSSARRLLVVEYQRR